MTSALKKFLGVDVHEEKIVITDARWSHVDRLDF